MVQKKSARKTNLHVLRGSNVFVGDKYCLRACIVNFRTSKKDIREVIEIVVREGRQVYKNLLSK